MDRKTCLDTASAIVSADRQNDYGTPESNFSTIAAYWNIHLNAKARQDNSLGCNVKINPADVAIMMTHLKMARLIISPSKEDNWVDACGYMANGCEIATGVLNG